MNIKSSIKVPDKMGGDTTIQQHTFSNSGGPVSTPPQQTNPAISKQLGVNSQKQFPSHVGDSTTQNAVAKQHILNIGCNTTTPAATTIAQITSAINNNNVELNQEKQQDTLKSVISAPNALKTNTIQQPNFIPPTTNINVPIQSNSANSNATSSVLPTSTATSSFNATTNSTTTVQQLLETANAQVQLNPAMLLMEQNPALIAAKEAVKQEALQLAHYTFEQCIKANMDEAVAQEQAKQTFNKKLAQGQAIIQVQANNLYQTQLQLLLRRQQELALVQQMNLAYPLGNNTLTGTVPGLHQSATGLPLLSDTLASQLLLGGATGLTSVPTGSVGLPVSSNNQVNGVTTATMDATSSMQYSVPPSIVQSTVGPMHRPTPKVASNGLINGNCGVLNSSSIGNLSGDRSAWDKLPKKNDPAADALGFLCAVADSQAKKFDKGVTASMPIKKRMDSPVNEGKPRPKRTRVAAWKLGLINQAIEVEYGEEWYLATIVAHDPVTDLFTVVYASDSSNESFYINRNFTANSSDGEDVFAWRKVDPSSSSVATSSTANKTAVVKVKEENKRETKISNEKHHTTSTLSDPTKEQKDKSNKSVAVNDVENNVKVSAESLKEEKQKMEGKPVKVENLVKSEDTTSDTNEKDNSWKKNSRDAKDSRDTKDSSETTKIEPSNIIAEKKDKKRKRGKKQIEEEIKVDGKKLKSEPVEEEIKMDKTKSGKQSTEKAESVADEKKVDEDDEELIKLESLANKRLIDIVGDDLPLLKRKKKRKGSLSPLAFAMRWSSRRGAPVVRYGSNSNEKAKHDKQGKTAKITKKLNVETNDFIAPAKDVAVGWKVEVWWPRDKIFYPGLVKEYDEEKDKHRIYYDDGDDEWVKLSRQKVRWYCKSKGIWALSEVNASRKKK